MLTWSENQQTLGVVMHSLDEPTELPSSVQQQLTCRLDDSQSLWQPSMRKWTISLSFSLSFVDASANNDFVDVVLWLSAETGYKRHHRCRTRARRTMCDHQDYHSPVDWRYFVDHNGWKWCRLWVPSSRKFHKSTTTNTAFRIRSLTVLYTLIIISYNNC